MKTLLIALLLVASLAIVRAADNPQPTLRPHAQPQKWEYATLQITGPMLWRSGKGVIVESDFSVFRAKLAQAGILGPIDPSADVSAELWQAIGDKGWELVAATVYPSVENYYFKRPKT